MFTEDNRLIYSELLKWKNSSTRKPMLLRGARQVGKTTTVDAFGKEYRQYLKVNLENKVNAAIFREHDDVKQLLEVLFFTHGKNIDEKDTLLFIDEIQEVPEAVNLLRYFYEDLPHLHVIAAGSLLETIFNRRIRIPVGRVEYRILRPLSFPEFLHAMGEKPALQQFKTAPVADFAHDKLMELFRLYVLIGGMPEAVFHYAKHRDAGALRNIYNTLLQAYIDDVEKYARNETFVHIIRHIIRSMNLESGSRIKFQNFGHSNYGSREVREALHTLEKAMLLHLVYPSIDTVLPLKPDLRKSPRLHVLDTGLMNHFAGLQTDLMLTTEIDKVYYGKVIEHIVGQELLASQFNVLNELHFWTRDKKGSSAEVDYLINYNGKVIPIEVKSGATGTLRSLHLFMESAPHDVAVRLYGGKYNIDYVQTPSGKKFRLINLPYYLASKIENYLTLNAV